MSHFKILNWNRKWEIDEKYLKNQYPSNRIHVDFGVMIHFWRFSNTVRSRSIRIYVLTPVWIWKESYKKGLFNLLLLLSPYLRLLPRSSDAKKKGTTFYTVNKNYLKISHFSKSKLCLCVVHLGIYAYCEYGKVGLVAFLSSALKIYGASSNKDGQQHVQQ